MRSDQVIRRALRAGRLGLADRGPRVAGRRFTLPLLSGMLSIALVAGVVPGVGFASSETPAEKAREIQAARDRANAAADDFFAAESRLVLLEEELVGLERSAEQLQSELDDLRREVEGVAIARFVGRNTAGIPLLTEVSAPQDQVQADVFGDLLTNEGADVIDRFEAAQRVVGQAQDDIAEQRRDIERQRAEHARLRDAATAEVERLREIEQVRLQDEAVQRALDAQLAKERARLAEEARLEAEAAARAQPNPGLVVPETTLPPAPTNVSDGDTGATDTDDAGAVDTDDGAPSTGDPADGTAGDGALDDGATDGLTGATGGTAPDSTLPPASTLPENSGASGGTSGGRTGGGGSGSSPVAITTGSGYVDIIVCPMPGSAYGDTWGAPRSGGRRHEGVDMIAPRGTPIVAVTNGVVTFKSNRLGGNAVSLVADNGNRYYYAHLDSYAGASRRVVAGEVIGYNGDTGNAKSSTPHLHFQVHPGGGRAVNPTSTVRAAGC